MQHVTDIEPLNDRIVRIMVKGRMPTTLLGVYMPQAGRPEEEREKAFETLSKTVQQYKGRGPHFF